MSEEDCISVIVTAYNRKQYLDESLRSLERQTLPKDRFEVILITNFEFDISGYSMNIRPIVMEGSIGKFIQRGILESNNDRICFLDDDDLFHPQKLQIIFDSFGPEYMYFKNSYKIFYNAIESFNEIARLVKLISKSNSRITHVKNPFKNYQMFTQADMRKTFKELRFKPTYDLKGAIREMTQIELSS